MRKNAKEPSRIYTRFYNETKVINDWTDEDELTEAMIKLFSKEAVKSIQKKVASAIDEFDWVEA